MEKIRTRTLPFLVMIVVIYWCYAEEEVNMEELNAILKNMVVTLKDKINSIEERVAERGEENRRLNEHIDALSKGIQKRYEETLEFLGPTGGRNLFKKIQEEGDRAMAEKKMREESEKQENEKQPQQDLEKVKTEQKDQIQRNVRQQEGVEQRKTLDDKLMREKKLQEIRQRKLPESFSDKVLAVSHNNMNLLNMNAHASSGNYQQLVEELTLMAQNRLKNQDKMTKEEKIAAQKKLMEDMKVLAQKRPMVHDKMMRQKNRLADDKLEKQVNLEQQEKKPNIAIEEDKTQEEAVEDQDIPSENYNDDDDETGEEEEYDLEGDIFEDVFTELDEIKGTLKKVLDVVVDLKNSQTRCEQI